jgi:NAD(P)H-hydrate epimerase
MTDIPYLTTDQMREVDRAMVEDYHIELLQMMENAGRNLAHLSRSRFFDGDPRERTVVVMAGRGGNGGGGLVCARRLHNWGANVHVITTHPDEFYRGVPAHQLDILRKMDVPIMTTSKNTAVKDLLPDPAAVDLIVDAVIGYSLSGPPRGTAAQMITWANARGAPILSLDVPSGIDTTSGKVHSPAIRADATLTLALPKEGLRTITTADYVGELYLADISIPPGLYAGPGVGLSVGPIFAQGEIIRL